MSLLRMEGITKKFPGVIANDQVDLELEEGEIHALLGENGSGKSTLMNTLYGIYRPDAGRILYRGEEVHFSSPTDAIASGIGMVHQHFMLVPTLTVTENVILGLKSQKSRWNPILDMRSAENRINKLAELYGLNIDPKARVWQLPVGAQQRVEILKSLYRNAELLILDEPTAVLAPKEVEHLIDVLKNLARSGKSIIFISHKLNEVIQLADRISVLRNGVLSGQVDALGATTTQLAEMMVGRHVESPQKTPAKTGKQILTTSNLVVKDDRALVAVKDLTFDLSEGEIVGVAGVDGNGQKELTEAIAGVRSVESGSLHISGLPKSRGKRFRTIGHVTEDRHQTGVVLPFSLWENYALKTCGTRPFGDWSHMNVGVMQEHTTVAIDQFSIKANGPDVAMSTLSGGNQQKLVLARELALNPTLLLAAQPTRGLDVGAAEYVHGRLLSARDSGMAILLISTELEEIWTLSDRIIVMYEGESMGIVEANQASREMLGLMMAGVPLAEIENGTSR